MYIVQCCAKTESGFRKIKQVAYKIYRLDVYYSHTLKYIFIGLLFEEDEKKKYAEKKCISAGEEKEEDSTCVSNVRIGYDLMVDFLLLLSV